jgi:lipopolysaccharide transport system permease protein
MKVLETPDQTEEKDDIGLPLSRSEEPHDNRGSIETVLEPPTGWLGVNWREVWRYRELLYFLTWRDVKVRYKQTVLGVLWAILQPVMTMVVFTVFFGNVAGIGNKTGGVPYSIYVYAALLPWTFFANALSTCSNSLVGSTNLISKVYFPRLVIPFASVGANLVDFGLSALVMLALMVYFRVALTVQILFVPVLVLCVVLAATGVGTLLAALTVKYRDFKYVVPFMVNLWMFVTPVIYPASTVPSKWQTLLVANPMTGIIGAFRSAFLGQPFHWPDIAYSFAAAMALFLLGTGYFRQVERRFADII